ncbi:MAG: hypothetical protein IPN53_07095 [Comamonadaceae bacterium]|nr:hypothetical protein [Comamonadaceae bacterium]
MLKSKNYTRNLQSELLSQRDDERFRAYVRDSVEAKALLDAAEQEPFEGFVAAFWPILMLRE